MRSLSPQTSRKASDSQTPSDDRTTSTQHGIREDRLPASSGSLSQGQPDATNIIPDSWDDVPSNEDRPAAERGDNRGRQPELSAGSPSLGGRITDYESTTTTKVISDGPLFKVVTGTDGPVKGSPIAKLPNGTFPFPSTQIS